MDWPNYFEVIFNAYQGQSVPYWIFLKLAHPAWYCWTGYQFVLQIIVVGLESEYSSFRNRAMRGILRETILFDNRITTPFACEHPHRGLTHYFEVVSCFYGNRRLMKGEVPYMTFNIRC